KTAGRDACHTRPKRASHPPAPPPFFDDTRGGIGRPHESHVDFIGFTNLAPDDTPRGDRSLEQGVKCFGARPMPNDRIPTPLSESMTRHQLGPTYCPICC